MKISYSWLQQFLQIDWEPKKVGALLTDLGLEVENIETKESVKGGLQGVVVGEVLTCVQHPNAEKLKITTVHVGTEVPLQIICGAPNVATGQKVPVATIGTVLYDAKGTPFNIKKQKIRGEESYGMICAEDELGFGTAHDGILVLEPSLKVGTPLATVFDVKEDTVFEIGLTPNRADAMSHFGVARDLRAGLMQQNVHVALISPSVSDFHVDERKMRIDVEVENRALVPRYCGITITDVEVKESPKWMQDRLNAIGISPKNNIVDITNYVLHELGQPLHAFDASKIRGNKIVVKTLKEGTPFTTLDGVKRKLSAEDIMICDAESRPLCIGGVFGGLHSGITENTSTIFLESAYFNPVSIRKTAKRHQLHTDASFRFERGVDSTVTEYALKRAALLIEEYAKGRVSSDIVDLYPEKIEDFQVFLSYENTYRLIGQEIAKETIKNILVSLDIKINIETEGGLGLTIPSYRVDVKGEADIIEEILRVYGYNNIKFSHKLSTSISFDKSTDLKVENTIADQLVSLGFKEMMTNSLTKAPYVELSETLEKSASIEMLNPLSSDLQVLRQSLLFSGLESIAYNINRKSSALKLYEFGKTYHKLEKDYREKKHLSVFATGDQVKKSWNTQSKVSDFFYIKGIAVSLLTRLGMKRLKTTPLVSDIFTEGIALLFENNKLVELGVVKPSILKKFGIKQEVLFADFHWEKVLELCKTKRNTIANLPKYPPVKRDLALLLDHHISFEQLYDLAFRSEKKILKEVDLFDVYEGDTLPKGKKSYALRFVLQDQNKTLEEPQIEKTIQKIQRSFKKELDVVLR